MKFSAVEEFLLGLPGAQLTFPFGEDVNVYKIPVGDEEKMFALMPADTDPVRLSLKCDPQLARILRERYESVMEGYHLNKKHWNTMLLTGQLTEQEVHDLIMHSYHLVAGIESAIPDYDRKSRRRT